ncbi:MAG: cryptochrome/photolyase family protein [Panacagrimonas sp.]
MDTVIVWFRRDLRLADNPALHAALERHARVIPVFIHDPNAEAPWAPGGASRWWLHHSLDALDAGLREAGASLVLRVGDTLEQLRQVVHARGATAVYWNRLYEPAFVARDKHVKEALRAEGLTVESFNAALLFEPWTLKTGGGEPYKVFSPLWRNASVKLHEQIASGRAPLPAPQAIPMPEKTPDSLPLQALDLLPRIAWDAGFHASWKPGEAGALARLESFVEDAAGRYREERDLPAVDATSCLSAPLHFGEISPLQLVARLERLTTEEPAAGVQANVEWYVRELGWREFAHHLLFHFPRTPEVPMVEKFAAFPWRQRREYAADLVAWQRGRTGIPIVDAGMRQLWHTGWMHNRVRMIVASFLTKNLLIPWQEGARWFWDTLVDASLANNTLGWQWSAGCGADAAPYFRIFNPILQSAKFDSDAAYIKRWVPELLKLPADAIHAPWLAKAGVLAESGVKLGQHYPAPVVDLAGSRERALAAYQAIKTRA